MFTQLLLFSESALCTVHNNLSRQYEGDQTLLQHFADHQTLQTPKHWQDKCVMTQMCFLHHSDHSWRATWVQLNITSPLCPLTAGRRSVCSAAPCDLKVKYVLTYQITTREGHSTYCKCMYFSLGKSRHQTAASHMLHVLHMLQMLHTCFEWSIQRRVNNITGFWSKNTMKQEQNWLTFML